MAFHDEGVGPWSEEAETGGECERVSEGIGVCAMTAPRGQTKNCKDKKKMLTTVGNAERIWILGLAAS